MDYFFMFDKIFGEIEKGLTNGSNYITKRRWYECKDLEDKKILMYDVSGIDEKDLRVNFGTEGYYGIITITGETKTDFGTYKCHDRFKIPMNCVGSDSNYDVKNGILYIEIVADKKNQFEIKKKK